MSDINKKHEDGAVYFFAKKNAQDAMLAHQDELGHQFAVCRCDENGRAYASYSDAQTFAKIYTTEIPENRRFHYEIIREGKPVGAERPGEGPPEGMAPSGPNYSLATKIATIKPKRPLKPIHPLIVII